MITFVLTLNVKILYFFPKFNILHTKYNYFVKLLKYYGMKTIKTITTAKDILALVNYLCSQEIGMRYQLCKEQDILLKASYPDITPQWIIPITISGKEHINCLIFKHEFCSLASIKKVKGLCIEDFIKKSNSNAWHSHFHNWVIKDKSVITQFTISEKKENIYLPQYLGLRCYDEHQTDCPILFLTPDDIINNFPFKEVINGVKDIKLKITDYNEPVWLLTQKAGKKYIIYPCALHRFYDELNVTHLFPGELKDPQKDEDFLVSHLIGGIISPLIAFKINSKQELSVIRFSEMNLKKQNNNIMSEIL